MKTADEAALYGGLPGEAFDPCYHQPCDNLTGDDRDEANEALYDALDDSYRHRLTGNVNRTALDVNCDALAAAIITFAFDTSTVNGAANAFTAKSSAAASSGGVDLNALRDRLTQ